MREKNNHVARWITGVFITLLGLTVTGSMWAGALDNRVSNLEDSEKIRIADHDMIIEMYTKQGRILEELEELNDKLDDDGEK